MPSVTLSLTFDAPTLDESAWSTFESLAVKMSEQVPGAALAATLEELQAELLDRVCGPRWAPVRGVAAPFSCPGCGTTSDFVRKGWRTRPRRFDISAGPVLVRLAHVGCRVCGKVFAPLLRMWDLSGKHRTDRLTFDLAELAAQMSFARASEVAQGFGRQATPGGAHRAVAEIAGMLTGGTCRLGPDPQTAPVVILDGTRVRAGTNRLGTQANIAIGLRGRSGPRHRRRAATGLLGATVGEPWAAMGNQLAGLPAPALVVVDGEPAITRLAVQLWPDAPIQRCWWHLGRGFRWALYADRAPAKWANDARNHLIGLCHRALAEEWTIAEAFVGFDELAAEVAQHGFHATSELLAGARPQTFTCLDQDLRRRLAGLGGPELGSGVLERVMRDLNARTDIGGARWSIAGLRDLVTVTLARRFDHPAWQDLRRSFRLDVETTIRVAKFNAG
jgi:hypothetical protein